MIHAFCLSSLWPWLAEILDKLCKFARFYCSVGDSEKLNWVWFRCYTISQYVGQSRNHRQYQNPTIYLFRTALFPSKLWISAGDSCTYHLYFRLRRRSFWQNLYISSTFTWTWTNLLTLLKLQHWNQKMGVDVLWHCEKSSYGIVCTCCLIRCKL